MDVWSSETCPTPSKPLTLGVGGCRDKVARARARVWTSEGGGSRAFSGFKAGTAPCSLGLGVPVARPQAPHVSSIFLALEGPASSPPPAWGHARVTGMPLVPRPSTMLHLSPECGAQGRAEERPLQTLPPLCIRCPAGLTGTSQDTLESRTRLPVAGRGHKPGCLVRQQLMGAVQDLDSPLGSPTPSSVPGGSPGEKASVAADPWVPVGSGLRPHWQERVQGQGPGWSPLQSTWRVPSLPFLFSFILLNHKCATAF